MENDKLTKLRMQVLSRRNGTAAKPMAHDAPTELANITDVLLALLEELQARRTGR